MTNRPLLEPGLAILSACLKSTNDIWEAHFGAAAIAASFFIEENGLTGETAKAIAEQAGRMVARHPLSDASAEVSTGRSLEASAGERIIADALAETIDGLHWVGHNVIYAAIGMKAIRELGGWGTKQEIGGIAGLIRSFKGKIPGRSWIGFKTSEVKAMIPPTAGEQGVMGGSELSRLVLHELASFKTIYRAEAHHDLIGHMLTFSHALVTLEELGYADLFQRGLVPLFKLIEVLKTTRDIRPDEPIRLVSPVDREPLQAAGPSPWLPTEPAYWQFDRGESEWDFGHTFKFPYSFYHHVARAGGAEEAAFDNFRRIIS